MFIQAKIAPRHLRHAGKTKHDCWCLYNLLKGDPLDLLLSISACTKQAALKRRLQSGILS